MAKVKLPVKINIISHHTKIIIGWGGSPHNTSRRLRQAPLNYSLFSSLLYTTAFKFLLLVSKVLLNKRHVVFPAARAQSLRGSSSFRLVCCVCVSCMRLLPCLVAGASLVPRVQNPLVWGW